METDGGSVGEIYRETGWFWGADGKSPSEKKLPDSLQRASDNTLPYKIRHALHAMTKIRVCVLHENEI